MKKNPHNQQWELEAFKGPLKFPEEFKPPTFDENGEYGEGR